MIRFLSHLLVIVSVIQKSSKVIGVGAWKRWQVSGDLVIDISTTLGRNQIKDLQKGTKVGCVEHK